MGGATAAIREGYYQKLIARSAYRQQKEIEEGSRVVVGLNDYTADEPERIETLRVDPGLREEKCVSLRKMRESRDGAAVARSLSRLRDDVGAGAPTMQALIECARQRATLGEMSEAVGDVFGRYRPEGLVW